MNTSMILRQRALQLQRISYFFTYKRYYGGTRYTVNDLRRQGDRVYKLYSALSFLWQSIVIVKYYYKSKPNVNSDLL